MKREVTTPQPQGYMIIKRYNDRIEKHELSTREPIAAELIKVLQNRNITLNEGDTITFVSELKE